MLNAAHSFFKMFQSNYRRCPSVPGSAAVAGCRIRTGCAHEHL